MTPGQGWGKFEGVDQLIELGWWRKLSRPASAVYVALVILEQERRLPVGSPVFASREALSEIANVFRGGIVEAAEELAGRGLISFVKASPRPPQAGVPSSASSYQRVIPIPGPDESVPHHKRH